MKTRWRTEGRGWINKYIARRGGGANVFRVGYDGTLEACFDEMLPEGPEPEEDRTDYWINYGGKR